jgi:hypothetical protein
MQRFGERGRLARRFRRLSENSFGPPMLSHEPVANSKETGWRDASQGGRDDRATPDLKHRGCRNPESR